MKPFDQHLFVCVNERPAGHPRGDCASKGGQAVIDALKADLAKKAPGARIRVNKAGCLDQCEKGCAMVIYPQATWYSGVSPKDAPEIVDALLAGGVVERLSR